MNLIKNTIKENEMCYCGRSWHASVVRLRSDYEYHDFTFEEYALVLE